MPEIDYELCVSIIESLISKTGKPKTKVFQEAGVNRSIVDNLKKHSAPSIEVFLKLSIYFGVSIEYLLGIEKLPLNKKQELNNEISALYDSLPEDKQGHAIDFMKYLKTSSNHGSAEE